MLACSPPHDLEMAIYKITSLFLLDQTDLKTHYLRFLSPVDFTVYVN
jgi:hypothetical protein